MKAKELIERLSQNPDAEIKGELKIITEIMIPVGEQNQKRQSSDYNKNTGEANSGYGNTGDYNSGHHNSGLYNSGDYNSGLYNSGDYNSGYWNSGNGNSGYFNSITPDSILVFNKECSRIVWEKAKQPRFIRRVIINHWVRLSSMTEEEIKNNNNAFVDKGYLKTVSYKEAWGIAWKNATEKDREKLFALPNFDAVVFEEITGIDVTE